MKIGVFGGAFNPIHNGHLNLADYYLNSLKLDKIIFIPTSIPPHKTAEYLVSAEDRINMLKLAISDNEKYDYSDIEFKRDGKSYTYDTLCQLKEIYSDADFYLIIGSDQFFYFQNWYRADDILNMVTVVTAAREKDEYNSLLSFKNQYDNMKNTIVSNCDVVVVSSSEIRDNIKNGRDITSLVPQKVFTYIKDNNLYV